LHKNKVADADLLITFRDGFVRVRNGAEILEEGWAEEGKERTFKFPKGYSCEVLGGPDIMFTKCGVE
jgi:hypothetical protein